MQIRIDNSKESIRLRRSQSTLVIVGSGIMLMGIWSAIKAYSYIVLRGTTGMEKMRESLGKEQELLGNREMLIAAVIGVTIYALFELGLRFYIGRCAISEGRGRGIHRLYIFFTVLICIVTTVYAASELYFTIKGSPDESVSRMDSVIAFTIDITSLVMMLQMIESHSKVKKYYNTGKAEAGHAE